MHREIVMLFYNSSEICLGWTAMVLKKAAEPSSHLYGTLQTHAERWTDGRRRLKLHFADCRRRPFPQEAGDGFAAAAAQNPFLATVATARAGWFDAASPVYLNAEGIEYTDLNLEKPWSRLTCLPSWRECSQLVRPIQGVVLTSDRHCTSVVVAVASKT